MSHRVKSQSSISNRRGPLSTQSSLVIVPLFWFAYGFQCPDLLWVTWCDVTTHPGVQWHTWPDRKCGNTFSFYRRKAMCVCNTVWFQALGFPCFLPSIRPSIHPSKGLWIAGTMETEQQNDYGLQLTSWSSEKMIHGLPQARYREEVLHHAIRHLLTPKSSSALQPVNGAHEEKKLGPFFPWFLKLCLLRCFICFFLTFAPLKFIPF